MGGPLGPERSDFLKGPKCPLGPTPNVSAEGLESMEETRSEAEGESAPACAGEHFVTVALLADAALVQPGTLSWQDYVRALANALRICAAYKPIFELLDR